MSIVYIALHQLYYIVYSLGDATVVTIQEAMNQIMSDTNGCVTFRSRQDYNVDYLDIFPGKGCVRVQSTVC